LNKNNDFSIYFAKYLTSPKLLDLQLKDSNFRRQILIQFLVLFQYTSADVRFKTNTQVLNDEQTTWIKNSVSKVYQLLKETPPDGELFASSVKHILEREEIWNKWKNEGCPDFVAEKKPMLEKPRVAQKRPKPTTSDFAPGRMKNFLFDNSEMAKLCNINHDNLNVCRDPERQFLPSLKDFFDEAIDQIDPANQVEKEYWLFKKTDWSWKSLRLLAKRSSYYFTQNQNVKSVSDYLESVCQKLSKEFATSASENQQANEMENTPNNDDESVQLSDDQVAQNAPTESTATNHAENPNGIKSETKEADTNGTSKNDSTKISNEERLKMLKQEFQYEEFQEDSQSSTNSTNSAPKVTKFELNLDKNSMKYEQGDIVDSHVINLIADHINNSAQWKKLSECLEMDDDTIAFIETDVKDLREQCQKIIQLWKEKEEMKATIEKLFNGLSQCGYIEIVNEVTLKLNQKS